MNALPNKDASHLLESRIFAPLLLALLAVTLLLGAGQAFAREYLIRNVTIIPMDAPRTLDAHDVLIVDGEIAAIAATGRIRVSEEVEVIDGTDRFVMPGLSDMHAHIGTHDRTVDPAIEDDAARNEFLLSAMSAVTLMRDPGGSPRHFVWREKLASGEWVGPELYFTGPIIEGEDAVWGFSDKILDPAEVEPHIASLAEAGYWGVKVYHTISREVFDAIVQSAQRHGLKVVGHVPFSVGIDGALESGLFGIEHLRGYDFDGVSAEGLKRDGGRNAERLGAIANMSETRRRELVHESARSQIWNTPTLVVNKYLFDAAGRDALLKDERFRLVHPMARDRIVESERLDDIYSAEAKKALRDGMPAYQRLVQELHAAGGNLLIGTDTPIAGFLPGFTPIDEMLYFSEAGIDNFSVLEIATVNAARSLDVESRLGTVAVGKKANLVLLDANPLEDLNHLRTVAGIFTHGTFWSREAIVDQLERLAE